MPKHKKFPEYDWIQDRIDDLDKTTSELEETAKEMSSKNPLEVSEKGEKIVPLENITAFDDILSVELKQEGSAPVFFVDYIYNNGTEYPVISHIQGNMKLYTTEFSMDDLLYKVAADEIQNIHSLIEVIMLQHPENIKEKYKNYLYYSLKLTNMS